MITAIKPAGLGIAGRLYALVDESGKREAVLSISALNQDTIQVTAWKTFTDPYQSYQYHKDQENGMLLAISNLAQRLELEVDIEALESP
jgi:hypothetical protein